MEKKKNITIGLVVATESDAWITKKGLLEMTGMSMSAVSLDSVEIRSDGYVKT
jgi:hypothetical protein